jgi:hypothetical protein
MSTKQSFSILVWVLKYRQKNGKAPLSIRITVNGERAEILANREVSPTLWDSKAQKVKGINEEAKAINAHLETIKGFLRMHESRLIALGKTVTAELLKNEYLGVRPERHSLCTAFEVHIKRMSEKVKAGNKAAATLDKYRYTFDKVKAFLKHQYKVSDIYLEDIKRSFAHDFEHYLFTVEHLQNNTVMKYLRQTKTVLNKELTTHTARHTFATTITLENDVPIETVSKMLGHRSIKTTQRYAKVTRKKISKNMAALKEKLLASGQ